MNKLARTIATFFFVGYAPVAPGTVATIPAVALAFGLARLGGAAFVVAIAVVSLIGTWAAGIYERESGMSDPSAIVIDEVAGYLVAVAFLPMSWPIIVVSFFAFRAFDIFKPPPIRRIERIGGGAGVVADDLVAGLYTNLLLRSLLLAGVPLL